MREEQWNCNCCKWCIESLGLGMLQRSGECEVSWNTAALHQVLNVWLRAVAYATPWFTFSGLQLFVQSPLGNVAGKSPSTYDFTVVWKLFSVIVKHKKNVCKCICRVNAIRFQKQVVPTKGVRKGGVGVNRPPPWAYILQKFICAKETNCFRILFAC